jgi:hypothetical protein
MPQCRMAAALQQFMSSTFCPIYVKHLSQNLTHYRGPVGRPISALTETGLSAISRIRTPVMAGQPFSLACWLMPNGSALQSLPSLGRAWCNARTQTAN